MSEIRNANEYGAIGEYHLVAFEKEMGVQLPDDYRQFMLKYNGGRPAPRFFNFKDTDTGSDINCFYALSDASTYSNIRKEIATFHDRIPRELLPVGCDSYGNQVCLRIRGNDKGKIYFWDHEREADPSLGQTPSFENVVLIADSFSEFLSGLHEVELPSEDELTEACEKGNIEFIRKKIDAGLTVNTIVAHGFTMAQKCAIYGQTKALEFLLNRRADPIGCMVFAAQNNQIAVLRLFIERKYDINERFEDETPLIRALWNGRFDSAKLLIEAGADVNAKKGKATTISFISDSHRDAREEMYKILKDAGAKGEPWWKG